MSTTRAGSQAAAAARRPPAGRPAVRPVSLARAGDPGQWWRMAWLAVVPGAAVLLAAACGGRSPGLASPPGRGLYQQELSYSRCMRSHGVPDFPILKQEPGGTLVHPLSPPAGMLASPGYDAAFRACLKLAVIGGSSRTRYQATALKKLRQAECMRAHGITGYPSPATLDGGIHVPDFTAIGLDPHTLQFQTAGQACGLKQLWQALWWWPAALAQPGAAGQYSRQP